MGASGDPMRTIFFGWQRRAVLLAAAMILSVIAACAGPRTVVDYNQGIDFSRDKTYQWAPLEALGVAGPEDPRISPLLRERINARFPASTSALRFRTSTNCEDLEGFPCAGCYE